MIPVIKIENCKKMVREMIDDSLQESRQLDPFRVQLEENSFRARNLKPF